MSEAPFFNKPIVLLKEGKVRRRNREAFRTTGPGLAGHWSSGETGWIHMILADAFINQSFLYVFWLLLLMELKH